MFRFKIGNIEVTRVQESLEPVADPFQFFNNLPDDAIGRHEGWLAPVFFDTAQGKIILSVHSWLIKTSCSTILLEGCAGNHKSRPTFPRANMRNSPWIERLQQAGATPEDIDFVLCTHLHADHVGWFTVLDEGEWRPTFPNASYLIDSLEYDNWNPATRALPDFPLNENAFEDSVKPVVDAGQMKFIEPPFEVEPGIHIVPARGHTMGHVAIKVVDGAESALFTGDAIHSPLQIAYPDAPTYACEDQQATIDTHRNLLSVCADEGHLFVPTHFPEPYSAVRIVRIGERFGFTDLDGNEPAGMRAALEAEG